MGNNVTYSIACVNTLFLPAEKTSSVLSDVENAPCEQCNNFSAREKWLVSFSVLLWQVTSWQWRQINFPERLTTFDSLDSW